MFNLDDYQDAEALNFGCYSQVGVLEDNYPLSWGNYFYLMVDDVKPAFMGGKGREIEIVNMWYENLKHLVVKGEVSFPIKIKLLDDRCGIVVDPRVNPRFLCEITYRAPKKFWSLTALTKRQMDIDSGVLKVHEGDGMNIESREIKSSKRKLKSTWSGYTEDTSIMYLNHKTIFNEEKESDDIN